MAFCQTGFDNEKSVLPAERIGDLYWDPALVRQPGVSFAVNNRSGSACVNVVETTTFFDYNHKALPVASVAGRERSA